MPTDEFTQQMIRDWSTALTAVRRAGGHHITLPVADLAVILHVAETNTITKET
jgi:hypothetical protein